MLLDTRDLWAGIDPGQNGGIAILDREGAIVDASKMPETEKDVSDYFSEFGPRIRAAFIEAVHPMPTAGTVASFKFGMSYGALRMALIAHNIPFEGVSPQSWQKAMGCTLKGRTGPTHNQTEKKNHTKARAQELFPGIGQYGGIRITHALADALLLAQFCRRKSLGLL